ncbi:MAG TPA: hypothetical protein VF230_10865 [Acidimicrobiales bacterium]
MSWFDEAITAVARARGRRLVTREETLIVAASDRPAWERIAEGVWSVAQPGVYTIGPGALTWAEHVLAATLAAGQAAVASHRAALLLWGMDGIRSAAPEVTVAHATRAALRNTIVHRSRRLESVCWVAGVPTTSPERTLLECGAVVPPVVVEKAFASAWRAGLTSPEKALRYSEEHGGKGRTGVRLLREIAATYADGARPPGSAAEVDLFRLLAPALADAGIEPPVRQFAIPLSDGSFAVVDSCWPERRKVVEVEGLTWHGDFRAHDYDTYRRGLITDAGYSVRSVTPRALRERPTQTLALLLRFLGAETCA